MGAKYFLAVRPQTNENHAIHKEGCPFLPDNDKRIYLGKFGSGKEAAKKSRQHFLRTDICPFCSKEKNGRDVEPTQINRARNPVESLVPVSYYQGMLCCLN